MDYIIVDGELYHYGVKGMKWGKRMARGHAGPGRYSTKKRQLAGDKKDLEYLNKGGHLSVGLTKKRQAAYDERDKARLEKRIAKTESQLTVTQAKKELKAKYKSVQKDFDKAYMKAYNYSYLHPISQYVGKKQKAESGKRWNDAIDKADKLRTAKAEYKQSKKYIESLEKTLIKDASKDLDKPYKQQIGPGVYANWPTKRKFIEAEINRIARTS